MHVCGPIKLLRERGGRTSATLCIAIRSILTVWTIAAWHNASCWASGPCSPAPPTDLGLHPAAAVPGSILLYNCFRTRPSADDMCCHPNHAIVDAHPGNRPSCISSIIPNYTPHVHMQLAHGPGSVVRMERATCSIAGEDVHLNGSRLTDSV